MKKRPREDDSEISQSKKQKKVLQSEIQKSNISSGKELESNREDVNAGDAVKRKNCMKHKKKDKKSREESQKQKRENEKINLPRDPKDFSSNWRLLLEQSQELKDEQKRARKRKKPEKQKKSESPEKSEPSKPDIWFDDVDEILIEGLCNKHTSGRGTASDGKSGEMVDESVKKVHNPLVKPEAFNGPTKIIAMDCEMVGVGEDGNDSILARVSIVNQYGECIYDTFVQPTEKVTDYRTNVSGVRSKDMSKGKKFEVVQRDVSDLLEGRTLVGHALHNDMKVLFMNHPRSMLRDTSTYSPFRAVCNGRRPALRKLAEQLLHVPIQTGEHSSIQDAQAAMRLYTMYRKRWEKELGTKKSKGKGRVKQRKKKIAASR